MLAATSSPELCKLVGRFPYLGSSNQQLDLPPSGAHKLVKLLTNTFQQRQSVVLSQSSEEVLDSVGLVLTAGVLLKLGYDLGFIVSAEHGSGQDSLEFWVGLEDLAKRGEGFGGGVEG